MLRSLIVRNILLVEKVELDFKPGLNTLTGETGVGKSVLLDCLGFALGWNNNSDLLRKSADEGEVIAEFNISNNKEIALILKSVDIKPSDTLIIRRSVNISDKRKRTFLNDKSISLELLQTISKNLVELQGQNDNQALLNEKNHCLLLDNYANLVKPIQELQILWKNCRSLEKKLEVEILNYKNFKLDEEYLKASIQEITEFNPQIGEEAKLDEKRKKMQAISKNRDKFLKANQLISDGNLETTLTSTIRLLESIRDHVGEIVEKPLNSLDRTLNELIDAQREVELLLDHHDVDINELENIEERLFKLRALGRKYNLTSANLLDQLKEFDKKLESLNTSYESINYLQSEVVESKKVYKNKSDLISLRRLEAAKKLDVLVMVELKYLKMPTCIFKTEISLDKSSGRGHDKVLFKVITNEGAELGALQEISSGGEMSRFLLALKVCLTNKDQGVTMIFDEIDRGIGGATADAVGRRLRSLSELSQVIVVTHSPQVAALGRHQWKVDKVNHPSQGSMTQITELTYQERLLEIARMLSGQEISSEAMAAAKKLLN